MTCLRITVCDRAQTPARSRSELLSFEELELLVWAAKHVGVRQVCLVGEGRRGIDELVRRLREVAEVVTDPGAGLEVTVDGRVANSLDARGVLRQGGVAELARLLLPLV